MTVHICRVTDPEVHKLFEFAQRCGYTPFQEKEWMCVEVLTDTLLWRAADSVFRPVKDGLYVFRDGIAYFEGDLSGLG